MARQISVAWRQKSTFQFIKAFQETLPEEIRITNSEERKVAGKILSSFAKYPPKKILKVKAKGLCDEEAFFFDFYIFLFVQRIKFFNELDFFDDEDDEIVEKDGCKTIFSRLKPDGVVFFKDEAYHLSLYGRE